MITDEIIEAFRMAAFNRMMHEDGCPEGEGIRAGLEAIAADIVAAAKGGALSAQDKVGPDFEGFCRDVLQDWPVSDIDGGGLLEAALCNGLIVEIPGGYDPERHEDYNCECPERGDPWYEYTFSFAERATKGGDA